MAMKRNAEGSVDINAKCLQVTKYPKLNVDNFPADNRIDCTTERLLLYFGCTVSVMYTPVWKRNNNVSNLEII